MMLRSLLIAVAVSPIIACNGNGGLFSRGSGEEMTITVNGTDTTVGPGVYVMFNTTKGEILAKLYHKAAPITVGSFVSLAEGTNTKTNVRQGEPYFDGLLFHRVIPGFMIQGGDPQGNGAGGPGYQFVNEVSDTLKHDRPGILSMANAGANTNGSQFFITDAPTPHLNGGYSVFGHTILGTEVVSAIANTPRNGSDRPRESMVMNTVRIIRVGKEAENYDAFGTFETAQTEFEAQRERQQAEMQARNLQMQEKSAELAREIISDFTWYQDGILSEAAFTEEYNKWKEEALYSAGGLGIIHVDVPEGGESVDPTEPLKIDYVGYLTNGVIFDSSLEEIALMGGVHNPQRQYVPLPVTISSGRMIQGWLKGIPMMKKGERARLIIPSDLGYGPQEIGGGLIPANSTLIFDVYIHE